MSQLQLFQSPAVRLKSSFGQILGESSGDIDEAARRARWEEWLTLARRSRRSRQLAEGWTDVTACTGCIHLDGYWCKLPALPCTVNPYLTFRTGMLGMACMGVGYEDSRGNGRAPEPSDTEDNGIPF
jgi:hypothetical protein